jgi:DNA-binding SARP family transcriptional activator
MRDPLHLARRRLMAMAHLSISLLGTLRVTLDGEPVTDFATDKARALLAYLAVESDRPHRRDALAGLLWPDQPQKRARQSLRQALSDLRKAIGDQDDAPFLLISREDLQFNAECDHWLDVAELTDLVKDCQTHHHRRRETCLPCIRRMERIVELYEGPFLQQFFLSDSDAFEEWAVLKREWLQREVTEALSILTDYCKRRGDHKQAQQYARRHVGLEPWREEAHRQLMQLLALDGQRSAALAQYETCRRLLADELSVEPTPETEALYEEIRTGKLTPILLKEHPAPRQANDSVVWISLRPSANTDLSRFFNVLSGALDEFGDAKLHAFLPAGAQVPVPLAN